MIDFRCDQCGKLLRAPLDAVGKQSRCPACNHVQPIPAPTASAPASTSSLPPLPSQPGANPFAQGASATAYDPNNPYAAPAYDPRVQAYALPGGPIVPTRISVSEVLSQASRIFSANIGPCIGVGVVAVLAMAAGYAIAVAAVFGVISLADTSETATIIGIGLFAVVAVFVAMILAVWLFLGILSYFLKLARGQNVALGEMFSGGRYLLNGLLAWLIVTMVSAGVSMIVVVPLAVLAEVAGNDVSGMALRLIGQIANFVMSIGLGILFGYVYPVVVDREVGPIDAIRISFSLTRINVIPIILLYLVAMVTFLAGFMTCGIGLLVAMPFTLMLWVVSYLHAGGQPTAAAMYR